LRIVLDTNILVSGVLSPAGAAGALLDLALSGQIELVSSPVLLEELEDVLGRFVQRPTAAEIRAAVEEISHVVEPVLVPALTDDPDDDQVLAAAVSGQALYVITRDRHLLALGEHASIRILDAAPGLHAVRAGLEDTLPG
jgi:uncharacterized protein